jgi:hypothetical protein
MILRDAASETLMVWLTYEANLITSHDAARLLGLGSGREFLAQRQKHLGRIHRHVEARLAELRSREVANVGSSS